MAARMRLSARASGPEIEVSFLGRKLQLTPDQAREFSRSLALSIRRAELSEHAATIALAGGAMKVI